MKKSFGTIFVEMRKEKGWTQDEVAQKLNVSPQAVSKWENDLSYPDVTILVDIANLFGTSVDHLLGKDDVQTATMVAKAEKKPLNQMLLKVIVNSSDGDKVRINLPLSLIKIVIDSGLDPATITTNKKAFENIDFAQILSLVEQGVIGKLVEVESSDGDLVEIYVE
ncbi:MAG: helix-turn-helix transcriptional regulator [Bacilli bacterium]|nr:helix-turn-helix transcriptional regulator [Bacilli bacterium]